MTHPRPAFALRDLCFGLAALALAAAIVLAATPGARKRAQLAAAQNQLRWIAGVTGSYTADFEDRMWGLSWQAGVSYPYGGGTTVQPTGLTAVAHQATDILNRRGRPDMVAPNNWYAGAMSSHLPLLDYLDREAPDLSFVSPGDKHRLNWTKDPQELHDKGFWLPYQESATAWNKRWPYTSSFQSPPALVTIPVQGDIAVRQTTTQWHNHYVVHSEVEFQGVLISSISFPSQKVALHESTTWYVGSEWLYFANPRARVNVLAADGSAGLRATSDANPGWRPEAPTFGTATRFRYEPRYWEGLPPAAGDIIVTGHYRYTRGGPAGRDFGGPEVDTGQP